jgi:hypothetical protein
MYYCRLPSFWSFTLILFRQNTVDILIIVASRVLLQLLAQFVAVKYARGLHLCERDHKTKSTVDDMNNPLLTGDTGSHDVESGAHNEYLSDEEKLLKKKRSVRSKRAVLGSIFLLTTLSSIYTAVKCVLYNTKHLSQLNAIIVCILMASGVLWSSLEVIMINNYVEDLTGDKGVLIKSLHLHGLHYTKLTMLKWCDICRVGVLFIFENVLSPLCPPLMCAIIYVGKNAFRRYRLSM